MEGHSYCRKRRQFFPKSGEKVTRKEVCYPGKKECFQKKKMQKKDYLYYLFIYLSMKLCRRFTLNGIVLTSRNLLVPLLPFAFPSPLPFLNQCGFTSTSMDQESFLAYTFFTLQLNQCGSIRTNIGSEFFLGWQSRKYWLIFQSSSILFCSELCTMVVYQCLHRTINMSSCA